MLYHLFQTLVNGISLMTRQECVIRIAKINKVFGELKYRIDIEEVPNFASFVPILLKHLLPVKSCNIPLN